MKLNFLVFSFCFFLVVPFEVKCQTVLLDEFLRPDNSVVGNSWVETETVNPTGAVILNNQLKEGSNTSGRDYALADVSTFYNTVFNTNTSILTWAFNMRQTRVDPSGFDAGNYGVAFVLGCSTNNLLAGSGYAVVLGNSGTSDNLRLVRFAGGVTTNAGLVNIIAPAIDYGADYLTVKVTYNPVGNAWRLFVGSNLTFFDDPATASYTQLGATTSDNTYTGTDLLYVGCLSNHATSATDFAYFDNVRIPAACTLSPEPTVQSNTLTFSSVGSNSVTLNWNRGNGAECIIFAHKGGAVTTTPVDGSAYFSNTTFGLGTLLATNEYVVYAGSASTVTISGLVASAAYEFRIFELNGTGCTANYLVANPAVSTVTTIACSLFAEPTVPSTAIAATNVLTNSMDLSWTRGNGSYCIVVGKAGGAVGTAPFDGVSYIASSIFGVGSFTGAGEFVLYAGTGNAVAVTGLVPSTAYYFAVYEMNGSGCNTNYLTTNPALNTSTTLSAPSYTFFYGNLHSHSDYSDGDMDNVCNGAGSAYCCYDIGNTALNFDYMGISDHNHNEGPVMTIAKYASGLNEAASYNSSHTDFVALYGMEWGTISTGGHVGVYGINQLVGWNTGNYNIFCAKGDYNSLFNLVASTPGAFVTLCHPNTTDYGNLLTAPYNLTYDNAITGVAVRNGPYNSTNLAYADPSTSNTISYFRSMLSKGYHVAPTADLDNHNSATMGKCSQQRTVLLATALNLSAVEDAITNMRFYATDDYNVRVTFDLNGSIVMGSIASQTGNPVIHVTESDPDGDLVSTIKIYYGIPGNGAAATVLTSVAGSATLTFTHTFASGTYYYYAEITQADGNIIYTAPIWYTKTNNPLPVELLAFSGEHIAAGNNLHWSTASELNNDYFVLERSIDAINFKDIALIDGAGTSNVMHNYSFIDKTFKEKVNYYRLRQTDFNNTTSYSNIVAIQYQGTAALSVFPNPGKGEFTVYVPEQVAGEYTVKVFDNMGRLLMISVANNVQNYTFNLGTFADGIYSVVVANGNTVQTFKIVKN